jgi:hypothetical protein
MKLIVVGTEQPGHASIGGGSPDSRHGPAAAKNHTWLLDTLMTASASPDNLECGCERLVISERVGATRAHAVWVGWPRARATVRARG